MSVTHDPGLDQGQDVGILIAPSSRERLRRPCGPLRVIS